MKRQLIPLLIILIAVSTFADIPDTLNFQGRLMDQSGQPVTNGQYSVTFRLYTAASGGNMVWEEQQTVVTQNGYFNTVLGNTTALTPSMFNQALWAGMQIGSNPEMTPRQKLSTAAYAMTVADGTITTDKIEQRSVTDFWSLKIESPTPISTTSGEWSDVVEFKINSSGNPLLINAHYSFFVSGQTAGARFRLNFNGFYYAPFEIGQPHYANNIHIHNAL